MPVTQVNTTRNRSGEQIVTDIITSILSSGVFPPGCTVSYVEAQNVLDMLEEGIGLHIKTSPTRLWREDTFANCDHGLSAALCEDPEFHYPPDEVDF